MIVANEWTHIPGHSFTSAVLAIESSKPDAKWKRKIIMRKKQKKKKTLIDIEIVSDTILACDTVYICEHSIAFSQILHFLWINSFVVLSFFVSLKIIEKMSSNYGHHNNFAYGNQWNPNVLM